MRGGRSTKGTGSGPAARAALVLIRPFQRFFSQEAAGSLLLLACTVVALVWANSPLATGYEHLWETTLTIGVSGRGLSYSLHHWINDGLMALFFFVIGLEIKREVLVGELSTARKSALPIAAAVGGMVVPAAIYATFNAGGAGLRGWGVPMATDIAFALGVLALLGPRVPAALRVFLAALAIADDLGAVLVIAVFYTEGVSLGALALGAGVLAIMFALNRAGVRHALPYAVLGVVLWLAVLQSGVHATVAGVLAATTIPANRRIAVGEFARRSRDLVGRFTDDLDPDATTLTENQRDALYSLDIAVDAVETPLGRLERVLHPWVAYFIMPVFALTNAGVHLGGELAAALRDPIALGVAAGLLIGKPVGITLLSWLAVRTGVAALPGGVGWHHMFGVAMLCGIGFTMSLFIANLAFPDPGILEIAKIGTLAGSLVAGTAGWIWMRSRLDDRRTGR